MVRKVMCAGLALGLVSSVAAAANLAISLGIRETGSTAAIGAGGGTGGSLEWVDLDGQSLVLDGTWQQFSFDLNNDPLTPFTGDGILDGAAGTLEHIRIRNIDGVVSPITMWVDNVANTVDPPGLPPPTTTTFGDFENAGIGSEYLFQEPSFSGSTSGNVLPGSVSGVADDMVFAGTNAYKSEFQFVDNDPSRWIRYTTFGTAVGLAGGDATISFEGSVVTFMLKAVPEPSSLALLALGGVALVRRRFR